VIKFTNSVYLSYHPYSPLYVVSCNEHHYSIFSIYCAGCGYIAAFTKDLTMYQIYHTWIHPLHHYPLNFSLPNPGIVSTDKIFVFTYMCSFYTFLHCFHSTTSPLPLVLPLTHRENLFWTLALWVCIRKGQKWKMYILLVWDKDSYTGSLPCGIFMYICIVTPISLSPIVFFIVP
jgi:hypothetical protein